MAKLGINGFGRLGRQLLKVVIQKCKQKGIDDPPKVVMINDAKLPANCLAYLLKNDSYYGQFKAEMRELGDSITIDGLRIEVTRECCPEKIPWKKCGAQYIIDTSGMNTTCNTASKFITGDVKRMIVTGCANVPMFVVGVNHCCFTKEMKAVSVTTPSMNCLAILLRVLHENFEVDEAMATAFHPLDSYDKILDDAALSCRGSRSAMMSFSPIESTTKKRYVAKIMPELEGKVESAAIKMPVPCIGGMDLTIKFKREAPLEVIKCRIKEAAEGNMKEVLGYTDEELVSWDLIGNPKSCVVDGKATIALSKGTAKVFAWYDSEYAFANRLYDLTKYIASREDCPS